MKRIFCGIYFILTVLTGCNLAVDFPVQKGNGQVRLFVSDGTIQPSTLLRGVCGFPVITDLTASSVKELDLTVQSGAGEMQYSKKDGNLKYDATSIMLDPLPAGAYTFTLKIVNTFATYLAEGSGQIPGVSSIMLSVNKVTPHIVLYSDGNDDAFYFAPDPENSKTVYKVEGLSFKETSSDPQKQLFTFDRQGRFYYMGRGNKLICLSNSALSCVTQGAFCIDTTNNRLYSSQYNNNNNGKLEIGMSTVGQNAISTSDTRISPNNLNADQFFSCLCYFDDYINNHINGTIHYAEKRYIAGYHIRKTPTGACPSVKLYSTTKLNRSSADIALDEAVHSEDSRQRDTIAYDITMVKNGTDVTIFLLLSPGTSTFKEMGYYTVTLTATGNNYQHKISGAGGTGDLPLVTNYPLEGSMTNEYIYGSRFLGHRGTKLYIAGKGIDADHIIVFDYANGTKKKISVREFKDEQGKPVSVTF